MLFGKANCTECGTEFIKDKYNKLYCSKACYKEYRRKERVKKYHSPVVRVCKYCGEEFIGKVWNKTCCSKKCSDLFRNPPKQYKKTIQCEYCGETVLVYREHQRFCSRKCRDRAKSKRNSNIVIQKKCDFCGKAFESAKERQHFCSVECRTKSALADQRGPDPIKICETCGKEFIPLRKGRHKKYCSLKCKQDHPMYRLYSRMSVGIRQALQKNKKGLHWEVFVDYTVEDLYNHFDKLMKQRNMSWDDLIQGKIHIDHIIPKVYFKIKNFDNPKEDPEFQKCWALSNLQPLYALDNITKNAKLNYEVSV